MHRLRRDWPFVAGVWLMSRLWLAGWAYAGHRLHPFHEPIAGGYAGVSSWWLNVWTTYDSTYFIEIAQHGYRPLTTAFFPLYPLLMHAFGPDENSIALAGVVISNASFLVALWLMLCVSALQFGEVTARRSVLVLAFFPTAVYSMAVYSDALFLMLSLGALYAVRQSKWWLGGVLGTLAALTRNAAPILAPALMLEWWLQRRQTGNSTRRRTALWLLMPAVAFVALQLYFSHRFGRLTLLQAQESFGRAPSWPWIPIWRDLVDLGRQFTPVAVLSVASSCLVFVFAWRYRARLAFPDALLMCGVMLMQLSYSRTFPTYTISSARYVLSTTAFAQSLTLEVERRSTPLIRRCAAVVGIMLSGFIAMLVGLKVFVS